MDEVYVDLTWKPFIDNIAMVDAGLCTFEQYRRTSLIYEKSSMEREIPEERALTSSEALFQKVSKVRDPHIAIIGEPGAGKSTFLKRICLQWASENKGIVGNKDRAEVSSMGKFTLVLPILLRMVQSKDTLADILKGQLNMSAIHIHCALAFVEKHPEKVLLILDGYDELKAVESCVDSILGRKLYPSLSLIVTTRPHRLYSLRNLGNNAVNFVANICGFSDAQIEEYINSAFKYNSSDGQKLLSYLHTEGKEMLVLAKLPIRLEIICVVWKTNKCLGKNIADLYAMFVNQLLSHHENKDSFANKKKSWKGDLPLQVLQEVSSLAYRWDSYFRLQTMFSEDEVQEYCPRTLSVIRSTGFISLYHTLETTSVSYWAFGHSTIQEYFAALYLSNHEEEMGLIRRCSSVRKFKRQEVILSFLCSLNPGKANKILTLLIKHFQEPCDCRKILDLTLKLIPNYRRLSEVDLPLPNYVQVQPCNTYDMNYLDLLFNLDAAKHKNLSKLETQVCIPNELLTCLPYLDELCLHTDQLVDHVDTIDQYAHVYQQLISISHLSVDLLQTTDKSVTEKALMTVLSHVPTDKLLTLTIDGVNVLAPLTHTLPKACNLQTLKIRDKVRTIDDSVMVKFCGILEKLPNISTVELTLSSNLNPALLCIRRGIRIVLKLENATKPNIETISTRINASPDMSGVSELDMSGNNLAGAGRDIGFILVGLPDLRVIKLGRCKINRQDIAEMACVTKKLETSLKLTELHIPKNNLGSEDKDIIDFGFLLSKTQGLLVLDMRDCALQKNHMLEVGKALTGCRYLTTLNLKRNKIEGKAVSVFSDLWYHIPSLQHLDLSECFLTSHKMSALLNVPSCPGLKQLEILDLSGNNMLGDSGLKKLAFKLPFLPCLRVLSIAQCTCSDITTASQLVANMPSSMSHLNMCNNDFGKDLLGILREKENLASLDRLNIGYIGQEEQVKYIKTEVRALNPDINVYFDYVENIWTTQRH